MGKRILPDHQLLIKRLTGVRYAAQTPRGVFLSTGVRYAAQTPRGVFLSTGVRYADASKSPLLTDLSRTPVQSNSVKHELQHLVIRHPTGAGSHSAIHKTDPACSQR